MISGATFPSFCTQASNTGPTRIWSGGGALLLAGLLVITLSACSTDEPARPEDTESPYGTESEPDAEERAKLERKRDAAEPADQPEETELLVEAMHYYDTGLFTAAKESFQKLQEKFPSSYYSVLAELKVADCNYHLSEYATAITQYQEFERLHPKHEAIPYVVLQVGNSHFAQYRGIIHDQSPAREAVKHFERVVNEFPASSYAITAAQSITRCRETVAAHEAYVAEFYAKQGQDDASKNRLGYLQTEYGSAKSANAVKDPASAGTGKTEPRAVKRSSLALLAAETLPPARPVTPAADTMRTAAASKNATGAAADSPSAAPDLTAAATAPKTAPAKSFPAGLIAPPALMDRAQADLKERVVVAASLSCERRKGRKILTTRFFSPELVQNVAVRSSAEKESAQNGNRSVVVELDVTTSGGSGIAAAYSDKRCVSRSVAAGANLEKNEVRFVEIPAPTAQQKGGVRTVQLVIPLAENEKWRIIKLNHPERLVALVF